MSLAVHTRLALVAASFAAALSLTADRADAAFTPAVKDRTLLVTGDAASEKLTLRVPPNAPATLEIDVGDDGSVEFSVPRSGFDRVRVLAGDGADRIRVDDSGSRAAIAPPTTIEGQGGADTLLGGRGADTLNGGDGDDTIDGKGGGDTVEGGAGFDRLDITGSAVADQLRLAANGARTRVTRDAGATVLDSGGVERLAVAALGGDDTLTVGDLSGTGVQDIRADLAGAPGSSTPDTGSDRVVLDGTATDDVVDAIGTTAGRTSVIGLPVFVDIVHADPARDELTINGLPGNDRIDGGGAANAFELVVDGGAGRDTLMGGTGADVLTGGDGDDFADGRRGEDVVRLGAGNDRFNLRAGDGRDTLEGETGKDLISFSGTAAGEQFDVSAAGQRARVSLGGAVVVDAGDVETLSLISSGGADTMAVNDLSGTGISLVEASLFDFGVPGGDQDVVRVNGTGGDDDITVAGDASSSSVTGLAATVRIVASTGVNDRLEVNGLAGADGINSIGLPPAELQFRSDGGAGNDTMLGGDGDDVLFGGDGADVVFAGGGDNVMLGGAGDDVMRGEEGDDVLDGGAGDDVLIGGAGDDVLLNGEVVFDD